MKKVIGGVIATLIVILFALSKPVLNVNAENFINEFNQAIAPQALLPTDAKGKPFKLQDNVYIEIVENTFGTRLTGVYILLRPYETGFDEPTADLGRKVFKAAISAVNKEHFFGFEDHQSGDIAHDLNLDSDINGWHSKAVKHGNIYYELVRRKSGSILLAISAEEYSCKAFDKLDNEPLTQGQSVPMTLAQFKEKFNAACAADKSCPFRMENEWRTEGDVQNVVQSFLSERVFLHLTEHKNGKLREVAVFAMTGADAQTDQASLYLAKDAYDKMIGATGGDAVRVQDQLQFYRPPLEWLGDRSTVISGKKYGTALFDGADNLPSALAMYIDW